MKKLYISLIKIFKESKKKINLSIVGAENNFDKFNFPENIKIFEIENNETNLINIMMIITFLFYHHLQKDIQWYFWRSVSAV
jgi:hypothetical protein